MGEARGRGEVVVLWVALDEAKGVEAVRVGVVGWVAHDGGGGDADGGAGGHVGAVGEVVGRGRFAGDGYCSRNRGGALVFGEVCGFSTAGLGFGVCTYLV